jgi:PTH1 family peptidyl-tRNA hydrolase
MSESSASHSFVVVGLGNPGPRYAFTRHNIGFMAVDVMRSLHGASAFEERFSGLLSKAHISGHAVWLHKPMTFMNLSGQSVGPLLQFYKIPPTQLIVIHDEMDLPQGALRVKQGGGHGGHNGIKDIARVLGPDFIRIRLGVGRPEHKGHEADWVLQNFSRVEQGALEEQIAKANSCVESILKHGLSQTQSLFNGR